MEAVSGSVFVVLQNYGLTWQHFFPSADFTVAGIGAIVLRKKAIYCKKLVTPFPWPLRGPPRRILLGRTNLTFPIP